jgi:hypothetical protein
MPWRKESALTADFVTIWCLLNPGKCPVDPTDIPVPPKVKPDFPFPPPHALQQIAAGNAISSVLELVGYVGPDQEGGPDPNGPLGPYIRDILLGLSIVQLSSQLSDTSHTQEMRAVAVRLVRDQADRIGSHE